MLSVWICPFISPFSNVQKCNIIKKLSPHTVEKKDTIICVQVSGCYEASKKDTLICVQVSGCYEASKKDTLICVQVSGCYEASKKAFSSNSLAQNQQSWVSSIFKNIFQDDFIKKYFEFLKKLNFL